MARFLAGLEPCIFRNSASWRFGHHRGCVPSSTPREESRVGPPVQSATLRSIQRVANMLRSTSGRRVFRSRQGKLESLLVQGQRRRYGEEDGAGGDGLPPLAKHRSK